MAIGVYQRNVDTIVRKSNLIVNHHEKQSICAKTSNSVSYAKHSKASARLKVLDI